MAIDYIIDYDCIPKQTLTTEGIVERLKGKDRAETIIRLFRQNGDERPPSEMGFEFTRSTPEGEEERRVIIVQYLLDAADELKPLEKHCIGCPANHSGQSFGCIGAIQYPVSRKAEAWLLDRLPVPDEPLVWLLLKQGVEEFQYDGASVQPLRAASDTYFEPGPLLMRRLGEFEISSDQVFEMIFAVGHINPNHAAILLLFFNAIDRELEADDIMKIAPASGDVRQRHPFILKIEQDDDTSIAEFKEFLRALYIGWGLQVRVLVDA
jgi:hypothetical protein